MRLAAVIGRLVNELVIAVQEIIGVVGVGVTVLTHIAVTVVQHQALAAARVAGHLVVINQAGSPLVALAVVEEVAQTAGHRRQCGIAGTGHRGVGTRALVKVKREVGPDFQGVVAVHLPLDAEVTTQVVSLVARHGAGVVVADRVGQQVLSGRAGAGVAVTVAVHDVTADAEVLIVLAADVEVDTCILRGGHATVTAPSLEAARRAVAEAKIVDVVAASQDSKLVAVAEVVDHHIAGIAVVGAVARVDRAEPSVVHTLLDREVDDRLILAVVNAREACQITLAVDNLELVDHLGGNVLTGHRGVVAEEFLAVDEDFLHLLAVGRDFAVAAHFNARQALEQVLDHGIGLGLVGIGVELDGVFLDRDRAFESHDHGLLKHNRVGIHLDHAHVHVAAVLTDGHVLDDIVVAQIGEAQQVLAGLDALDVEHAVHVGRGSLDHGAVLIGHEQPDARLNELGRVLGVHQHTINDCSPRCKRQQAARSYQDE